jgi:hypothetical protein
MDHLVQPFTSIASFRYQAHGDREGPALPGFRDHRFGVSRVGIRAEFTSMVKLNAAITASVQATPSEPFQEVQQTADHGIDPIAFFKPRKARGAATRAAAIIVEVKEILPWQAADVPATFALIDCQVFETVPKTSVDPAELPAALLTPTRGGIRVGEGSVSHCPGFVITQLQNRHNTRHNII